MNQLIKTTITIWTTAIIFYTLSSSAQAQQIWSGTGRIIEGSDRGASVKLRIRVQEDTATILSNPDPGKEVPLYVPTHSTGVGSWEIRRCHEDLCATLEQQQPPRTIYYRLYKE